VTATVTATGDMIALWDDESLPGMPDPEPVTQPKLTERDMLDLLHRRYGQRSYNGAVDAPRYICAEHVRARAGFDTRTADFIAVETWESSMRHGGLTVHGVEVKTSRSDWLRELADPDKAATSMGYASHCWLAAADASVVKPGELPDGWGLLLPQERSGVRVLIAKVKASRRKVDHLSPPQTAALLRAVAKTAAARAKP
jgi:hypothetical protein